MSGGKTKAVTPRLRFPEFRHAGPWEVKRLGEVCEILDNMRKPVTSTKRKPGPYPYYGASGAIDYIDEYIFDERLLLIGEDGAKWGPFEKTAFIVEGKYWVNNHAHVLRPVTINDVLLENYLNATDVSVYVTGAAPPKLTLDNLKSIRIPVPLVQEEQKKIANCLSSLDDLICAEASRLEALQAHKKGLMQQLFPVDGETTPRLRFPEFRNAGPWEVRRLGEYVEQMAGNSKLIKGRLYQEPGNDRFPGFSASGQDVWLDTYEHHGPAIIVSAVGARCGRCFFAEGNWSAIANTHILLPKQNAIDIRFLFETVTREGFWVISGSGQPFVKVRDSLIQKTPIPSLPEQQQIADCLSSLDDLIRAQGERIEALKQHKKGLLQQLFPQEIA